MATICFFGIAKIREIISIFQIQGEKSLNSLSMYKNKKSTGRLRYQAKHLWQQPGRM
jgi:hypothetical protein